MMSFLEIRLDREWRKQLIDTKFQARDLEKFFNLMTDIIRHPAKDTVAVVWYRLDARDRMKFMKIKNKQREVPIENRGYR